ncbi:acyl-CoA carboxylase subunit epsilon [Actinophytocola sp. NPDC049390]|uniref:acyl-CoA carboxylase subunit epsilon n=1 Tax=Actinophytocola sp. NPDC049390 TaxID=3363894 RepID=UPI003789B362
MSDRPHLRVVRGNPTDEEIAALITVVSTLHPPEEPPPPPRSAWSNREPLLRRPLPHNPTAWRTSARPH